MASKVEVVLTEELRRSYQRLPEQIKKKFDKQLRLLTSNPKHPSLKIHKLDGV